MAKGIDFPSWSIAFDEWKAQSRNIKAIVERQTKEIISPSAKDLQGENLTLGRELKLRIFALAQGRQIITWGLQGESDLLECFCSIFLGKFAVIASIFNYHWEISNMFFRLAIAAITAVLIIATSMMFPGITSPENGET